MALDLYGVCAFIWHHAGIGGTRASYVPVSHLHTVLNGIFVCHSLSVLTNRQVLHGPSSLGLWKACVSLNQRGNT